MLISPPQRAVSISPDWRDPLAWARDSSSLQWMETGLPSASVDNWGARVEPDARPFAFMGNTEISGVSPFQVRRKSCSFRYRYILSDTYTFTYRHILSDIHTFKDQEPLSPACGLASQGVTRAAWLRLIHPHLVLISRLSAVTPAHGPCNWTIPALAFTRLKASRGRSRHKLNRGWRQNSANHVHPFWDSNRGSRT